MTNLDSCFVALADPTRRKIFDRLARRPAAVRDLARSLPVSRPAVSQHLKALRLAGLVQVRAEGTRRIYQLDYRGLETMRRYFDHFWDKALAEFKRKAEEKGDST